MLPDREGRYGWGNERKGGQPDGSEEGEERRKNHSLIGADSKGKVYKKKNTEI